MPAIISPITKKVFFIIILALLLLIPSFFVNQLISERNDLKEEAYTDISSKWGKSQILTGPVIFVPIINNKDKDNDIVYLKILPEKLNINGDFKTEIRFRGIYKFPFYTSKIKIDGEFSNISLEGVTYQGTIKWSDAFINFGINDINGIMDSITIKINNNSYQFLPGIKNNEISDAGIHINLPINPSQKYKFEFDLNLRGSNDFKVVPVGKETLVEVKANWADPKFIGFSLPIERTLNKNDFQAKWKILDLNRNFPQIWIENNKKDSYYHKENSELENNYIGVNFFVTMDQYKLTERALKYIIIFVGLTFISFFFIEILDKKRLHIVQYLLVGSSLVIFYLLLIAISEHSNFFFSYILSTVLTILLNGLYSYAILKKINFSLIIVAVLSILYGFLYILLTNLDYALLIGAIGLFVILALIMFLTRNVEWYKIEEE